MMTVRFPNGQFVQYNDANFLKYGGVSAAAWEIYSVDPAKGGYWIASVSPQGGCILEVRQPCQVGVIHIEPDKFVDELVDRLKEVTTYRLARLKSALRKFDSRSHCWK